MENVDQEIWLKKLLDEIVGLEEALKEIEGDNGYAANEPEERIAILEPANTRLH